MNTKLFLLIGTSLSFLPTLSLAQCVATQDCATLGYTETSCNGGKGVKCPFGNKWACLGANEDEVRDKLCQELGFTLTCTGTGYAGGSGQACNGKYKKCNCKSGYKWSNGFCKQETCSSSYKYTCTGTGYTGGAGSACGGKYTQCTCASGYEWKNGSCQKEALNGAQGNLYYCDGKVVAVKAPNINFYVAMKDLSKMNWSSADRGCQNYNFCGNRGTLPSKEQLKMVHNNKSSLESLLISNGGKKFSVNEKYWSSTVNESSGNHFYLDISTGALSSGYGDHYARCILW